MWQNARFRTQPFLLVMRQRIAYVISRVYTSATCCAATNCLLRATVAWSNMVHATSNFFARNMLLLARRKLLVRATCCRATCCAGLNAAIGAPAVTTLNWSFCKIKWKRSIFVTGNYITMLSAVRIQINYRHLYYLSHCYTIAWDR